MTNIIAKIRLDISAPSEEVRLVAETELRETPERIREATTVLRELLKGL
jgi:hypothetical protein